MSEETAIAACKIVTVLLLPTGKILFKLNILVAAGVHSKGKGFCFPTFVFFYLKACPLPPAKIK